jgi:hypothetical protein
LNTEARERIGSLAIWFVENHPEHPALRGALSMVRGGDAFHQLQTLWPQQLAAHPRDPAVLGNAAAFYRSFDTVEALRLYEQARGLAPHDGEWMRRIAELHLQQARVARDPVQGKLALEAYRDLLREPSFTSYARGAVSAQAAHAALLAGDAAAASELARTILTSEANPADGYAVHRAHIILGTVALQTGDSAAAVQELGAACNVSKEPALASSGPDMSLANALLRAGRRDAVLGYLHACEAVWASGLGKLKAWETTIEHGVLPDFGFNALL